MDKRAMEIEKFLEHSGWADAARLPITADASFRRYERLILNGQNAVLMDAPPPYENIQPFITVDRYLRKLNYSAPEVLAFDGDLGVLLLEDLGENLYSSALREGENEFVLYRHAVDLLIDLQKQKVPENMLDYSREIFVSEALLFVDWYLPILLGGPVSPDVRTTYIELWNAILLGTDMGSPVVVLRDYHADNLLWLPDRHGLARVGLLDFQDALKGPSMYDLVSLLEDARRYISGAIVKDMVRYFIEESGLDYSLSMTAFAILGAQRNSKIIGIFTRLWKRDGKPEYLKYIPRVWRLLEEDIKHPSLEKIFTWFDEHVPVTLRNKYIEEGSSLR